MSETVVVNEPMDYFEWKSGSKVWPSSDPNDSPFDTFTCKICGWSSLIRVNGAFPIGINPWDEVWIRISEHLRIKHKNEIFLEIRNKR
ncbi:hypothetical protein ES705_33812 [subsurface metagenome]